MFSFIFTVGVTDVSLTDEEEALSRATSVLSDRISRQIVNEEFTKRPHESLLSILDDKNRLIETLNKQLENQKMQLTYYIRRELSRSKIKHFSESCTPQASEASLPLNLALNKFYKQAGIKTKLLLLHERMNQLDYKISNTLKDQEFMLRKIVNRLCEFVKIQERAPLNFEEKFGSFITDPLHVDLFDKLLSATISLKRKLDSFKICCERVLIIEEEKNDLVEQVYSLPVEERINRNYLLQIQMEKVQLENEIKRISQHQTVDKNRIKELNVIEKILHNLQWELNTTFLNNEESCISQMLKKINSEARVLLELTKEQRRKFEFELSKTKCPEPERVLLFINVAAERGKLEKNDFDSLGIKSEEEIEFFEAIKKEIDAIKGQLKNEAEEDKKKIEQECELLKDKLTQLLLDNSRVKSANKSLQEEMDELKLEQKNRLQRLKRERDVYKSQVEDLQSIREAYAQLVEKQPNITQIEKELLEEINQKDNRVLELENVVSFQRQEIEDYKNRLIAQEDQIVVLNRFINLTRPNSPRFAQNFEDPFLNLKPATSLDVNTEIPVKKENPKSESDRCCYKTNKTASQNKLTKSSCTFTRYKRYGAGVKKSKISKKSNSASQCYVKKPDDYFEETKYYKFTSNSFESLYPSDQESICCVNMFPNNNNSGNIVKAIVTSSEEVVSSTKKEKSSHFSLEITYKNSDVDSALLGLGESEIFKDVSRESLVLESRHASSYIKIT